MNTTQMILSTLMMDTYKLASPTMQSELYENLANYYVISLSAAQLQEDFAVLRNAIQEKKERLECKNPTD